LISKTNLAIARLQDITNRASELATQALAMLGINYRYGGNSPDTGLDCSGLVRYVFKEAWGTDLPRTSLEISRVGERSAATICSPATWCSTTPCAAASPTWASTWATASSSTPPRPVARCASRAWTSPTGRSASMVHAASWRAKKSKISTATVRPQTL
jgi:hypothetical protein